MDIEVELQHKYSKLCESLRLLDSAAVAFSGGVDSSLLLYLAHKTLGKRALAVIGRSISRPQRELDSACSFCKDHGIRFEIIETKEFEIEGFSHNPYNRCYLCKRELFSEVNSLARRLGMRFTIEGSNTDDNQVYRPGCEALKQLQVLSPLCDADLSKAEVRLLAKELGLSIWDKPSFTCLNTRFAYGDKLSAERLALVDAAEQVLKSLGFSQVRVRFHELCPEKDLSFPHHECIRIARIEVQNKDIARFANAEVRSSVCAQLKNLGFRHVAVDLAGYRPGGGMDPTYW